jgi:5-methyltetrahydrofolate--homocysteine methyltransferase
MQNRPLILDGAMGTMIQNAGLKLGEKPEIFALKNPQAVMDIQKEYVKAGSNVLYSNTFGANRHKMQGTGHDVTEIIKANVEIAKQACEGKSVKVALDIGPIGELMAPLGTLSFDNAYDIFKEMILAGKQAGADLVVFETFTDLYEVKAGVLAAKENSDLPVWVTMSFEQDGRTFTGTTVECMAVTLDALGVDAMGINCSLGPKEILPLIRRMEACTSKPLIAKPNAGLPDPATGMYFITPEEFAGQMEGYLDLGISAMGGCCGTTPAFIRKLAEVASKKKETDEPETAKTIDKGCICSSSRLVCFDRVNIIGEKINPTGRKKFKQALLSHDMDAVMELAIAQADGGADVLDINVGVPGIDEPAMMKEVVQAVQGVVGLPLMIDSSDARAIEAGLRYANGKVIVNSVNANDEKLSEVLPIAAKYGAAVVGLAMDRGLPSTVGERLEHAKKITEHALKAGIRKSDIIIDCLTLTVSAQQDQALKTLEAVRRVKKDFGLHTTLGVSNIAFGLPEKTHVTASFLTMALHSGLDLPIVNPNSQSIMDAIASFRALSGEDKDCEAYIGRFAVQNQEKGQEKPQNTAAEGMDIQSAILKGLGQETEKATMELLKTMDPMDVINLKLIPALDVVGEKYEKHELFLPQLINAANAAGKGFDLIKKNLPKKEDSSKGKIIIATVEGDIHDIGKNIVKVVLENYGFDVIDLGKDVPIQTVVQRTIEEDAHLVALSALMTTTVESMRRTIEALRQSGHPCKVMVGGAVLTADYAKAIGADFYTKDPKESADTARKVLG